MQNNVTQIEVALSGRETRKRALLESGAITQKIFDNNMSDIKALRAYFTTAGAIETGDAFGFDIAGLLSKLADKSAVKFRGLLKTLETGADRLDGYMRPVYVNAVLFGKKSAQFDNTTQQSVLSLRVDAERSALIKDRQHYAPSTAGSQTSQVRRLLIDSGLATGSDDEKSFTLDAEHTANKRMIEILSKKKK
jgi:hypothetical protein